jgi:hypothetical protein
MDLPIISMTVSIIFILFSYNAFKWLFRVFFVLLVVKGLSSIQKRGEAKIESLKKQFKAEEEPNV